VREGRRARAFAGAAIALVLLSTTLVACGGARDRSRGDLIDQLVEGGLENELAECVVDAFFDARDDDELRAFFGRDDLTADERDEFARLGALCTPE
jgi:hypothetical protein